METCSKCKESVWCSQHCVQSLPLPDLHSLPTSQPISRCSSFMVNFSVAQEHTGLLGLGSQLTPKTHSGTCLYGVWPLTRCRKHREQPCSPMAQDTGAQCSLQTDEGRRTGLVGRTHTEALYFCVWLPPPPTSGTVLSLLHPVSLLSTHGPLSHPALERSDFGGCCTSCLLVCFSCLLCDLPSPKAPAKLIQLPQYQWAQVFLTAWHTELYTRE